LKNKKESAAASAGCNARFMFDLTNILSSYGTEKAISYTCWRFYKSSF